MAQTKVLYSDLDLNLTPHPVTGDIVLKTGSEAISQSFKNLVLTNHFERPYASDLGGNVIAHLFELFTPITVKILEMNIRRIAEYDEPRARLLKMVFKESPDNNGLSVRLTYQPRHMTQPVVVDVFLRRLR